MRAMQFISTGEPLRLNGVEPPTATSDQLLLNVEACAVCRTDLHLTDGEVAITNPPRTLGHQIIAQGMLAAVPEPSTALMLAAGAAVLALLRRRRSA